MIKRIQNKVAESRFTLPAVAVYGGIIWLLCGLFPQQWWLQFALFAVSTYLMVELNNSNVLIRIYSRSVSAAYIILSCVACFLFPSLKGAFVQLCFIASLLTLFRSYQDRESVGLTFYTFVFLSLGSLVEVHTLWFIPCYWIMMMFFIFTLTGRTFLASLLGILLPYWGLFAWILWRYEGDFTPLWEHFAPLGDFQFPFDFTVSALPHFLTFVFLVGLFATGLIHYLRTSFHDKIRVRQIYYSLAFIDIVAMVFLLIQPQHEDLMLRVIIITTSPLIGHFIALTRTWITNIAFFVILGIALLLTIYNLWSSSFIF